MHLVCSMQSLVDTHRQGLRRSCNLLLKLGITICCSAATFKLSKAMLYYAAKNGETVYCTVPVAASVSWRVVRPVKAIASLVSIAKAACINNFL